jgi:hypothetical protein
VPAVVQHIRNVLQHYGQRSTGLDVIQIFDVQARARVVSESFRMVGNFTELRASDASKRLARRTTNDDIEGRSRIAQIQLRTELVR